MKKMRAVLAGDQQEFTEIVNSMEESSDPEEVTEYFEQIRRGDFDPEEFNRPQHIIYNEEADVLMIPIPVMYAITNGDRKTRRKVLRFARQCGAGRVMVGGIESQEVRF